MVVSVVYDLVYCCYTLFNNSLDNYSKKWKEKGIKIINGGVTSMGLLTNIGPQKWHPCSEEIKNICKKASDYCISNGINITEAAFHFVNNNNDIDTILIGVTTITELYDYMSWKNDIYIIDKIIFDILKPIQNKLWIEKKTLVKYLA